MRSTLTPFASIKGTCRGGRASDPAEACLGGLQLLPARNLSGGQLAAPRDSRRQIRSHNSMWPILGPSWMLQGRPSTIEQHMSIPGAFFPILGMVNLQPRSYSYSYPRDSPFSVNVLHGSVERPCSSGCNGDCRMESYF